MLLDVGLCELARWKSLVVDSYNRFSVTNLSKFTNPKYTKLN